MEAPTGSDRPIGPLPPGQHRDALVREVARVLAAIPTGSQVLVAASGGADSGVLAHLTIEARPDLGIALAHVRHGLRDDSRDVAAVTAQAGALGVELWTCEVTVDPADGGLEAAARARRYQALEQLAHELGAGWLLVGHTADDQAETLLQRMARGTGTTGLAGMAPVTPPARGPVAITTMRPLLGIRREDVRRFAELEGVVWADDPTNDDPSIRRVVVRRDVLPALTRVADDPVGALGRLADLARDDATYLDATAAVVAERLVRRYGAGRIASQRDLSRLDAAIARRVVRQLLGAVRESEHPVTAAHVEAVRALASGGAVDVPGVTVTCGGGWIAAAPADLEPPPPVPLAVPGATAWPAAGIEIVTVAADPSQLELPIEVEHAAVPPGADPRLGSVTVDADLAGRLTVRARAPGDRLRTSAGTRKLQDLLVDAGVPRAVRDLVPVVVADDRPVWVPGVAVDVDAQPGPDRPGLHLTVRLG